MPATTPTPAAPQRRQLYFFSLFRGLSAEVIAATTATAAGAILAMLADTMVPEAFEDARTFGYRDEMVVAYRKTGVAMRRNLTGTTKDLLSSAKLRNLRDHEQRRNPSDETGA